ncbi:hypothetical protein KIM372_16600 [Bombiscardovia nodaiensis]|uniref:Uncharacterized protein n=1 Tax=Bombiscardovia nodaiensis TaxID=2932181 RepID=A0ABN6SDS7_9BIFI|nr:hypothetical protein KIM372_16600 [Bombiscardovia nodaiensis]
MLGNAMIVALLGYVWASQALHGVSSAVNSFTSRLGVSSGVGDPSIGIGVFFRGWIAVALVLYAMVAVVFIGKKIYGDTVDIQEVHDKLSQIMIAFAALNIVLLLLTLIGASMMAGVIFMISLIFMLFIPSYLISVSTNRRQLDSFWLWAISMVVAAVVFFMILFLAINIAGSQFAQALISMMG